MGTGLRAVSPGKQGFQGAPVKVKLHPGSAFFGPETRLAASNLFDAHRSLRLRLWVRRGLGLGWALDPRLRLLQLDEEFVRSRRDSDRQRLEAFGLVRQLLRERRAPNRSRRTVKLKRADRAVSADELHDLDQRGSEAGSTVRPRGALL